MQHKFISYEYIQVVVFLVLTLYSDVVVDQHFQRAMLPPSSGWSDWGW